MFDGNGAKTWAIGKSHLSDDGLEITAQVEAKIFSTLKMIQQPPVQPSLPLPADQPAAGQVGRGRQRQGDQRVLLRRLARQDRPEQHQLRDRQLGVGLEVELPQLEVDERDVQSRDQQEVGSPWDHCLLQPSRPGQVHHDF